MSDVIIGDLVARMKLDNANFLKGMEATQVAVRDFSKSTRELADAMKGLGGKTEENDPPLEKFHGHMVGGARNVSRFAAILMQEMIPGLQGSRLMLEGMLQTLYRFATGWVGVGIAVTGAVAAIGYAAYEVFKPLKIEIDRSATGTKGLSQEIAVLNVQMEKLRKPGFLENVHEFVGGIIGDGPRVNRAPSVLETTNDLLFGLSPKQQVERNLAQQGVTRDIGNITNEAFRTLKTAVREFGIASEALKQQDPLGKVLQADWQAALNLAKVINETNVLNPQQRQGLLGEVFSDARGRRQTLTENYNKAGGAAAEQGIFGSPQILGAVEAIEKLNRDTEIYSGNLQRMKDAGVGAGDMFRQNYLAQEKLDEQMAKLREQFKDNPAALDLFNAKFNKLEFGGFARQLNALTDAMFNVKKGSFTMIEAGGEIVTTWVPALKKAGDEVTSFNTGLSGMRSHIDEANESMVFLTHNAHELAIQLHEAFVRATLLGGMVGRTANMGAAGPGGLVGAVGSGEQ